MEDASSTFLDVREIEESRLSAQRSIDPDHPMGEKTNLTIYVTRHCEICQYSYEVADGIRADFPDVEVCLIDVEESTEGLPDNVFATPTYLLNGRVWSLGNPSQEKVRATFSTLVGVES